MTETWSHTRDSVQRLRTALQEADEDTRYKFAFWVIGLAMMAIAITAQFGWLGGLFCSGMVVRAAGGRAIPAKG